MLYRKVPKNGDELSILGFGCMRLPVRQDGTIDENKAVTQIRFAIDKGVNYVDTAWPYHGEQSEPLVGRALAGGYREKVRLATKLPGWLVNSREDMDKFLNAQLEKLQTDHIDYYLVHALTGDLWDNLEKQGIAEFLDKAKADGRIVNAGFSFHGAGDEFKRIVDAYDWAFCMIQYNFLDEKNQAGTAGLEYAASKGLGVIVMEPLRGGFLASPVPPAVQQIWDESPVVKPAPAVKLAATLQPAAAKRSAAEWALRWVWNHPEVTVVLSGMNQETHIEENLKVAAVAHPGSLTEAELQLVKRVEQKYRELMKVGCTGCGYCMPCPAGVNIPLCFETYNNRYLTGNADEARFMYAARMSGILAVGDRAFASQCVQCGECLDKCPQHLEIPALLEAVTEELEGSDLEERVALAKQVFKRT